MKKVLAVVAIAVLTCSVAAANVNPADRGISDKVVVPDGTRTNGALGSLTITAAQVGALTVQVDTGVTTIGGDGVPFVGVTGGGATVTLNDQIGLYAQIYDAPWAGGCPSWVTPGANTFCAVQWDYFTNSPTALGSFAGSMTATVNVPGDYETFVLARAGVTWPTTGYVWGFTSSYIYSSAVQNLYIDSTVPPTATPDPFAGGIPVPTMNQWGVMAMVVLLIGVAMLIITRRS